MKQIFAVVLFTILFGVSVQAVAGYSAIAYNSTTQVWGEAHGYSCANDAINAAVSVCGAGCSWLAWAQNSCVALANNAAGDYGYSWGYDTSGEATNGALSSCNARGTGLCSLQVWACN